MHLERGRSSYQRKAWPDAYAHLSAAVGEGDLAPEDFERLATAAYLTGADADAVDALIAAHDAWRDAGEIAKSARCACWVGFMCTEAGERSRGAGWFGRAARMLEDSGVECAERGWLHAADGLRQVGSGDASAAHASFAEAVALGERYRDRDLLTFARHGQGRTLIRMGEVEAGIALLDEAMVSVESGELWPIVTGIVYCSAIDACRNASDIHRARAWTATLSDWCDAQPGLVPFRGECLVQRSEILRMQGAWPDALHEADLACETLTAPPGRRAAGGAFYQRAELHRLRGAFDEAEAAYAEATAWGRVPQPGLALLRLAQGKIDAARMAIERTLAEARDAAKRAEALPAYVEIMLAAGATDAARAAADELVDAAGRAAAPALEAHASHAVGAVMLGQGDPSGALPWLRRALDLWQDLDVPYEAARARARIGHACRAQGDEDTADMHLTAARRTFTELQAGPDLDRLEAEAAAHAASESPSLLTPRELEVLRRVAAGSTNKEIGGELDISERTVERHVSNIFDKTGVASRAAATAFAYQNGLL